MTTPPHPFRQRLSEAAQRQHERALAPHEAKRREDARRREAESQRFGAALLALRQRPSNELYLLNYAEVLASAPNPPGYDHLTRAEFLDLSAAHLRVRMDEIARQRGIREWREAAFVVGIAAGNAVHSAWQKERDTPSSLSFEERSRMARESAARHEAMLRRKERAAWQAEMRALGTTQPQPVHERSAYTDAAEQAHDLARALVDSDEAVRTAARATLLKRRAAFAAAQRTPARE